jgi:hypothetical protein
MRMARAAQTSFTSGEIGEALFGRIDISRYYSGAATMLNVLVKPQGGFRRRPGMAHLHQFASGEGLDGVRVIPFAFNTLQTYCIILTAGALHVFRSDGLFLATVTGCPWTGPQASIMNRAQSADTLLLFHPSVRPQQVRRGVTESTWTVSDVPWTNIPQIDYGGGNEAIMSDTRGWPECGTFHQGRLWIGGLASKPATFIASKVGDFFNLDQGTQLDDEAIVGTIDSDQVNAIHQLVSGRGLQMFTSGAEHVLTGDPLTPRTIGREEQTRRGIKRFVPTAEVDGATLFIQRQGAALRQFVFVETEQAWRSDLASLLAPHLIGDPRDMAARKTARQDDADHILMVNNDLTTTVLTTLRSQEVTAFTRWLTDGAVLSVAALASGEVFFAVQRNGSVRIETWAETRLLDSSKRRIEPTTGFSVMSGLAHLEGLQVAAIADGSFMGLFTVSGYSITLPREALDVEVGLPFQVKVVPLPLEPRDQSGNLMGRRSRIVKVTARVRESGTFTINGQPLVLRGVGRDPNLPLDTAPPIRSGDMQLRGLLGWQERHQLLIEQPVPGPLEVLALSYEMRIGE